jgi:hypothetical protein
MYRTVHPFIRKWVRMSEEYEPIYHQALQEMQQPDFQAIWRLLTVWGNVPPKPKPSRLDRE